MKIGPVAVLTCGMAFTPLHSPAVIYVDPPANLVQNGNFASGLSGWSLSGNGGYWFGYSGGADGGAFMGLSSLSLSPLYQNVPTTSGQSYSLSFYFRGSYPAGQSPPFGVNVFWNSQEVGSFTLNVFSSDWVYESLSVVGGPGSQSRLEFRDPLPTLSALDDVCLVAIPEPSVLAIIGLAAVIGLAWGLRTKDQTA
jgi:hypothetical protein